MKKLVFVPLLFVAACASRPQQVVHSVPAPVAEPTDSIRYGEQLQTYHVGRYVDPNHPETLHEQHPVYRLEASARWNLHPASHLPPVVLAPPSDPAFAPLPPNEGLVAEMNRQREMTARVMREASQLAQSFAELQAVFEEMRKVASTNALMSARLASHELRLGEFEKEIQKLTAPWPPVINDVPALIPEAPDLLKP